jgi:hypothetical protein
MKAKSEKPFLLPAPICARQFIGSPDACVADGRVVCLGEIVRIDPTVVEVSDLPPGWQAIREQVGMPWVRRPHPSIGF